MHTVLMFAGAEPRGWSQAVPFLYDLIKEGKLTICTEPEEIPIPHHLICVVGTSKNLLDQSVKDSLRKAHRVTIIMLGAKSPFQAVQLESDHTYQLLLRLAKPDDDLSLVVLVRLLIDGLLQDSLHTAIDCHIEFRREELSNLLNAYELSLETGAMRLREAHSPIIRVALSPVPDDLHVGQWLKSIALPQSILPPQYRPSLFYADGDSNRWDDYLQKINSAAQSYIASLNRLYAEVLRGRRMATPNIPDSVQQLNPWELTARRGEMERELIHSSKHSGIALPNTPSAAVAYQQALPSTVSAVHHHLLSRHQFSNLMLALGPLLAFFIISYPLLTSRAIMAKIWVAFLGISGAIAIFMIVCEVLDLSRNHLDLKYHIRHLRTYAKEDLEQAKLHFRERLRYFAQLERIQLLQKNRDELDRGLRELQQQAARLHRHRAWLREHLAAAQYWRQLYAIEQALPQREVAPPPLQLELDPELNPLYSPLSCSNPQPETLSLVQDGAHQSVFLQGLNIILRITLTRDEVYSSCAGQ